MSKEHTRSFVYGFAGVALMFGAMLIVAGVHNPNAAAETAVPVHFGVTDADLDMNSKDEATGSFESEKPSSKPQEILEFIDYTCVFPAEMEAQARKFVDLGASVSD